MMFSTNCSLKSQRCSNELVIDLLSPKHLTLEIKHREISAWSAVKSEARSSVGRRDDGHADIEIVDLCDELNQFDGICTLQSCAGHDADYPPHLWLALDEEVSIEFTRWSHVLACMEGIDNVAVSYKSYGQEVVEILFQDLERGRQSTLLFFRTLISFVG